MCARRSQKFGNLAARLALERRTVQGKALVGRGQVGKIHPWHSATVIVGSVPTERLQRTRQPPGDQENFNLLGDFVLEIRLGLLFWPF